jgi:RNA polymerase sigma-70 factor (ECF subfamily)
MPQSPARSQPPGRFNDKKPLPLDLMDRETQFMELRPLLFRLAYRMTGTRADAEDTVQEAFIRWQRAADDEIRSPKSYLTTVVARLSLDTLKSARRKREVYIGPWLPEPIVEPLGANSVEMAESLSLAFLHLLESLSPAERLAFILREVFETPYEEVASALETSEANCRQIVARATRHIREHRPRFPVDHDRHCGVLKNFLAACASGDPSQLMSMLREDVVLRSDGGGKTAAALNPIYGADRVARFFAGIVKKGAVAGVRVKFAMVNGEPGALLYNGEQLATVITVQLDDNDRITGIFLVANPDKLPRSIQGILAV